MPEVDAAPDAHCGADGRQRGTAVRCHGRAGFMVIEEPLWEAVIKAPLTSMSALTDLDTHEALAAVRVELKYA